MGKLVRTESRLEVYRGWREGEMESYYLIGAEFILGVMEKFTQPCEYISCCRNILANGYSDKD